jgi:hypothetical protein
MTRLVLLLVLGGALVRPVAAQIPVTDAVVGAQTTISAIQNVITAANMVLSVANQVLELTGLEEIVAAADIAEDMAQLALILQDAQGLIRDVQTLQRLFDPSDIPHTLPAMKQRVTAMDEALFGARSYALKAQTLVQAILSTTHHLISLVNHINEFVGNMQSNQSLAQLESSISKTLAILTTQAASQQRTDTLERMRYAVIVAMDKEITRQYWLPYFNTEAD